MKSFAKSGCDSCASTVDIFFGGRAERQIGGKMARGPSEKAKIEFGTFKPTRLKINQVNQSLKRYLEMNFMNRPVSFECFNGNHLQVQFFWDIARCQNSNTGWFEQFEIITDEKNEVKIRSRYNKHFLHVNRNTGECKFIPGEGKFENFKIEIKENGKCFIKCTENGKFLGCRQDGLVYCDFTSESASAQWALKELPKDIFCCTSDGIIVGACAVTVVPALATAGAFVLLPAIGFGAQGITAGSLAAGYQSAAFGGFTQAGSVFAAFQSAGVTGAGAVYGAVAGAVTGAGVTGGVAQNLPKK